MENQSGDCHEVFANDESIAKYPWKGAIIFFGCLFVGVFCFLILLIIGWVQIAKWLF